MLLLIILGVLCRLLDAYCVDDGLEDDRTVPIGIVSVYSSD